MVFLIIIKILKPIWIKRCAWFFKISMWWNKETPKSVLRNHYKDLRLTSENNTKINHQILTDRPDTREGQIYREQRGLLLTTAFVLQHNGYNKDLIRGRQDGAVGKKGISPKPDHLSSMPRICMIEVENWLHTAVFWPPHVLWFRLTCAHVHTP